MRRHPIRGPFDIAAHTHDALLQLDLLAACTGTVVHGRRTHPVAGSTVLVCPPGVRHGYHLRAEQARRPGVVRHVKIRWPAHEPAPELPPVLTGLAAARAVADGLDRLIDGGLSPASGPMPLDALMGLAEALSAWPAAPAGRAAARAPGGAAEPNRPAYSDADAALHRVRRVIDAVPADASSPPDLGTLAAAAKVSPRHFARLFRGAFGCTPHAYLAARRLEVARERLLDTRQRVGDVAEHLGFNSVAAFSRWFQRHAGMSPTRFRDDPGVF